MVMAIVVARITLNILKIIFKNMGPWRILIYKRVMAERELGNAFQYDT